MYLLRMEEALETDYPALAALPGRAGFSELVRDYVPGAPVGAATRLNRLGDRFPEFVRDAPGRAPPRLRRTTSRGWSSR